MTKLRNAEMERMYYIQEIKKDILKSLYAEAEKKLEKLMWEVGEENQNLLQCNTPTFFFNNFVMISPLCSHSTSIFIWKFS